MSQGRDKALKAQIYSQSIHIRRQIDIMGTSLQQSHHAEIHFSLIAPQILPRYLYFVLHRPIIPVRLSRALSIYRVTTLIPRELSQRQDIHANKCCVRLINRQIVLRRPGRPAISCRALSLCRVKSLIATTAARYSCRDVLYLPYKSSDSATQARKASGIVQSLKLMQSDNSNSYHNSKISMRGHIYALR